MEYLSACVLNEYITHFESPANKKILNPPHCHMYSVFMLKKKEMPCEHLKIFREESLFSLHSLSIPTAHRKPQLILK